MSSEAIWDRELTTNEWNKIKKTHGPARIATSLLRKVETLEGWSRTGVPTGIEWRKLAGSRTKLRGWLDPSLKLWPWADDEAEKRGGNPALIDRWKLAKKSLSLQKRRSPEEEASYQEDRASALERQVLALLADKAWLEDQLVRARRKQK